MATIKIGDRVRIKEQKDWPTPPGYRLANSEGVVVNWVVWQEVMENLQDYVCVHIEESEAKEYIDTNLFFREENLEKI